MKKLFKFTSVLVCMTMVLGCVFSLVACDKTATDAIEKYILPEDGTLVDNDFTLPATIGAADKPVEVTWTSSKTEAITIGTDVVEVKGAKVYNAKVTLQAEETEVELTISSGKATKTFKVRVAKLDVFTFINRYKFPQNKATVYQDFDLDSETEIQGKKATITWKVDDTASQNYIKVEGNKCKVTPNGMNPKVKLTGYFSYGSDKDIKSSYNFNVYVPMTNDIELDYWYHNTGVTKDMSGYVVEIATAYSDSYNNLSFYMVDESGLGGYYLYRAGGTNSKLTADVAAKIKPGAYVKVTGTTNTNYNGLVETSNSNNFGGNVTVDDSKSITKEELYTRFTKDIDTLVTGDLPELLYNESRLVRLTNWTVKSVSTPEGKANSETLMTLTKDGKNVNIQLSGYLEGAYTKGDTAGEWKKLIDLAKDKTGKSCTITGILSKYEDNFQLLAIDTAHTTFGEPVAEESYWNAIQAPTPGTYKLALFQASLDEGFGQWLYATAQKSGNFVKTTTDASQAAEFTISGDETAGYTIKTGEKFVELNESHQVVFNDTQGETKWQWNSEAKVFSFTVSDKIYYLGTYGTFNTISASETSRITGSSAKDVGVSQFPAYYGSANEDYVTPVGSKIARAEYAVSKAIGDNDKFILPANETLTLPTEQGDVKIDYTICWASQQVTKTANEADKTVTLAVAPNAVHDRVYVKVTYTVGEGKDAFSTYRYFAIETFKNGDQAIADEEAEQLTVAENLVQGDEVTLPKAGVLYKGVSVAWETVGTLPTGITLANSKLTIGAEAMGDCTITIKATVTYGTGTKSKEFSVNIPKLTIFTPNTEAKAGTFVMAMKKSNWIYFTGKMDGYYYGGTIKATEAAEVVITAVDGGYTITCDGTYLEIVPRTDGSKGTNVVMNKTQTKGKVWKWNADLGTFTMTSGNNTEDAEVEYFLGTSLTGNYTTFSAQAVAADASTKNAVAKFGTLAEATAE